MDDLMTPAGQDFEAIRRFDNDHFLHPWEALSDTGHHDRTIVTEAHGIYIRDETGRELIDGPGGMWCVQVGYGNREIVDAIAAQAMRMPYNNPFAMTSQPAPLLARRLTELAPPGMAHVFLSTGGSTAVDTALRFVQYFNNLKGRPGKKLFISREGAYHGSTYLSASCSGKERDFSWFDRATDLVHFLPNINPYRRPEGMSVAAWCDARVADLEAMIERLGPERVAAFIAEPIQASGGVIVPPDGYLKRCHEICRKHDVIYISDEVVTAFGRLGHWFASKDVFGIDPDIITCAKGITSGYVPLGACLISERLFAEVSGANSRGAIFSNGYTYSGHPVSCAAALKNIEVFEREGLLAHVQAVAPYFQTRLQKLRDIPIVGDVRGMGLVGCVECVISRDSKDPLKLDKAIGARIDEHCQRHGLIVRPLVNMCVFSPPLIITFDEIDLMMDRLEAGIRDAMDEVVREGLWHG